MGKEHQIRCYYELIDDGGRPPCSLETLDKIYESPADYVEMLRPWLGNLTFPLNPDDLGVFSRPLERWREFRRWQGNNRGVDMTGDENLAAFRDEKRRYFESTGLGKMTTAPYFDETIYQMWQQEQLRRQRKQDSFGEVCGGTFDEYVEAARRRLGGHSFTEAFDLLEDPKQQSERVTWIEYLEFEYWCLDRCTTSETQRHYEVNPKPLSDPHRRGSQSVSRNKLTNQVMRKTAAHRDAKADESRQLLRTQWALSQMPTEELDAPPANPVKRSRKRGRQVDDEAVEEPTEQPMMKKQKKQQQQQQCKESGTRRKATLQKTTSRDAKTNTRSQNPSSLRRSARIRKLQAAASKSLETSNGCGR